MELQQTTVSVLITTYGKEYYFKMGKKELESNLVNDLGVLINGFVEFKNISFNASNVVSVETRDVPTHTLTGITFIDE